MKTPLRILIGIVLLIAGFVGGIYYANSHVIYGEVDLASSSVNKKVTLLKPVIFQTTSGQSKTLPEGTLLNWEGSHKSQHYLSIRYVVEDRSAFEYSSQDSLYDFFQKID
jgi:hypothetical protein